MVQSKWYITATVAESVGEARPSWDCKSAAPLKNVDVPRKATMAASVHETLLQTTKLCGTSTRPSSQGDQNLTFHLAVNELTDPTCQKFAVAEITPEERITERTLEQFVDVPMPQIMEEATVPVLHVQERNVEVTQLIPQDRTPKHIAEQTVGGSRASASGARPSGTPS